MAITIIKAGSQYFMMLVLTQCRKHQHDARIDLISTRLLPCQCQSEFNQSHCPKIGHLIGEKIFSPMMFTMFTMLAQSALYCEPVLSATNRFWQYLRYTSPCCAHARTRKLQNYKNLQYTHSGDAQVSTIFFKETEMTTLLHLM